MDSILISPLTGKPGVSKIDSISREDIITLYRNQLGIDVSRFFTDTFFADVYECKETGYRFYYPQEIMSDAKFYEELQKKGESDSTGYYRTNQFDHTYAASLIISDEKVLDIGSGNGSFLKSILPVTKNITGIELNEYTANLCRKQGLEIFDELIESHAKKRTGYYDTVCSFQVLEHVFNVKDFIEYALLALKPKGKLIISVPNNEPWFLRFSKYETLNLPPHHMGLWNKNSFRKIELLFPVQLKNIIYSGSYSWKIDAYYRARNWARVKSIIHQHSLIEKIMIGLLIPFSSMLSIGDKLVGKIKGGQICVHFEKNDLQ
jgi:2-polyprenyl-3-methyl-5-hydroxy-6-metoxy-1,4-benzoquinol methylase